MPHQTMRRHISQRIRSARRIFRFAVLRWAARHLRICNCDTFQPVHTGAATLAQPLASVARKYLSVAVSLSTNMQSHRSCARMLEYGAAGRALHRCAAFLCLSFAIQFAVRTARHAPAANIAADVSISIIVSISSIVLLVRLHIVCRCRCPLPPRPLSILAFVYLTSEF